ncbi:MAG TPA: phosphotransacetylase family protein [Firmicutes bacterium]|nr:phosphotransacetylase family protein [Bacillota bacterium]
MKALYIIGTGGSGKTALCLALALKYAEEGRRVAYFKPVGNVGGSPGRQDEDAVLMKDLLKMEASLEEIVPFTVSPAYLTRYERPQQCLATVKENFAKVSEGCDAVVIEGTTSPEMMFAIGLDAGTLAKELGAAALTVARLEDDFGLDRALMVNSYLAATGVKLLGTVFNNIPHPLIGKAEGLWRPLAEERGFKVFGVVPARTELIAPTVREIWDILGGELLSGEERLDVPVEEVVVGAMRSESALPILRRAFHKAVITGGDRADIALTALETDTSVLILTGGLYPDVKVLAKAGERGVPVLLVPTDTYSTIERFHQVVRKLHPDDQRGIAIARESYDRHCDLAAILGALDA